MCWPANKENNWPSLKCFGKKNVCILQNILSIQFAKSFHEKLELSASPSPQKHFFVVFLETNRCICKCQTASIWGSPVVEETCL